MKIRVTECWQGGSRDQGVFEWGYFAGYARQALPDAEIARMKAELETQGATRLSGENYWFEYERVD